MRASPLQKQVPKVEEAKKAKLSILVRSGHNGEMAKARLTLIDRLILPRTFKNASSFPLALEDEDEANMPLPSAAWISYARAPTAPKSELEGATYEREDEATAFSEARAARELIEGPKSDDDATAGTFAATGES